MFSKFPHFKLPVNGAYYLLLISILVSFSIGFIAPIFPLYLRSLVNSESTVGYVTSIIAVLFLVSSFLVSKYLDLYKKRKLLILGLLGSAITVILFSFVTKVKYLLIIEIFRSFSLVSIYITTALLIKSYMLSKSMGEFQGTHFALSNIAWLIGPLTGGLLGDKYGFPIVFLISAVFLIIALILVLSRNFNKDKLLDVKDNHTFENIKFYFSNKNLFILYIGSIGLLMWWTVIYTFLPLYIKNAGLSTSIIGYVMFAVTIPLIILEIPIGKLADKHGIKKYLILGFFLMSIPIILTYFFGIYTILILVVLVSIGAAFLEPLRETYLYNLLNDKDLSRAYPVYRTSVEIAGILGPFIFSTILLYSNFKILFLVSGLLMLFFGFIMFGLKDIKK